MPPKTPMSPITMYSTSWCGHCRRLKRQLDEEGLVYREVDIDGDDELGRKIERVTGGYRTVPTVEIGPTLLVNPTLSELRQALATAS